MRSKQLEDIVRLLQDSEQRSDRPPLETVEDWRRSYERMARLANARDEVPVRSVDAGGVPAEWIGRALGGPLVVYLHGGGYCIGSLGTHRPMLTHLAALIEGRVLAADYRLAPEHPYPAALDDAVAAYRFALEFEPPDRVVLAGDSAGGGLVVATLVALRDAGIPLPAAAVCLSPWADLTQSGATIELLASADPLVRADDLARWAQYYAGAADPADPELSPVFAALHGLPPVYIEVGTAEILLDDSRRLARNAIAAGVDVTLHEEPEAVHVWHFFAGAVPEADIGLERIARFIRNTLTDPSAT